MRYFWRNANTPVALGEVRQCVVQDQPSLIYHPSLPVIKRCLYRGLQRLARSMGYQILADRRFQLRSPAPNNKKTCRRKQWVRAISLLIIVGQGTVTYGEDMHRQLQAMDRSIHNEHKLHKLVRGTTPPDLSLTEVTAKQIGNLEGILLRHWTPTQSDPENAQQTIYNLASYFSQFHATQQLLAELDGEPWTMVYRKDQFSSDVHGNQSDVDGVTIYFDPLSAGQFKFHKACSQKLAHCIAAPADLLLHELLHAYLALKRPGEFIRDGGMNPVMYPYRHENRTIELEQRFYRVMTKVDLAPRPRRTDHVGRPVTVSCITCLQ